MANAFGSWTGVACAVVPAAIVLLLIAFVIWSMSRKYAAIFANANIIEFAQKLAAVKGEACRDIQTAPELQAAQPAEIHHFTTDGGLVLAYTVRLEEGTFVHHLSISYRGEYIARAAASFLAAYIAHLLQLPPEALNAFQTDAGRLHVTFGLTGEGQKEFVDEQVVPPTEADLPAVRRACDRISRGIQVFQRPVDN